MVVSALFVSLTSQWGERESNNNSSNDLLSSFFPFFFFSFFFFPSSFFFLLFSFFFFLSSFFFLLFSFFFFLSSFFFLLFSFFFFLFSFFSLLFSFCLLPYSPPRRPYAGIFFLLFVLVLSMKQQFYLRVVLSVQQLFNSSSIISYLLRVILSVQQQVSVPLQYVKVRSSSYSLPFPFRSSCITLFRTRAPPTCRLFFASLSFSFFFFFSFSLFVLFLFFFSWSGLFCCVLVPGTLALDLLYLDELGLFGLLCFTVCL